MYSGPFSVINISQFRANLTTLIIDNVTAGATRRSKENLTLGRGIGLLFGGVWAHKLKLFLIQDNHFIGICEWANPQYSAH